MPGVEVELKYRVSDPEAAGRLIDDVAIGDWLPLSPARTTEIEDRYVDTSDGAIARAGYAARLRLGSKATLVTLKSLARSGRGALHRREELEGPADAAAAPRDWPASAARSRLLELAGDASLVERATMRQLRRVRPFRCDEADVELSLDSVDVLADGHVVERFTELEAELRGGPAESLGSLESLLDAVPWLEPSPASKLERALAAAGLGGRGSGAGGSADADSQGSEPAHEIVSEPPAPGLVVGKSPGVRGDDTLAEAGRKVLRFHLARMLAKEAGTKVGHDPEDLHTMRVATRRMRSAWRVFGGAYRQRRERRYVRDLREIAGRLGAVRDLDVLIEGLERYVDRQPQADRPHLEPLIDAWRSQREDARALLLRTLEDDAYTRFVDEYREFVRTEGLGVRPVAPSEPHRVRDRMPDRIWAAYEQVRAYEPILRWADVETLHALRIAAKRLRYTIEFVREALGPEASSLIERVVALQDHLGALHDADVSAGLARQFLVDRAADLSEAETAAIGRFLVDRERELGRLRRSVGGPWRRVGGLAFRRALGRTVAAL